MSSELIHRESLDTDASLCDFCYPSEERNILYEDENLYVMPCLGSFIEGYLLVINKDHEDCYGEVMDEQRNQVVDSIKDVLRDEYGSYCFYEHGRTGSCFRRGTQKVCYHAHIHCLPISRDFHDLIDDDMPEIEVDDREEIVDVHDSVPHYLYLETDNGRKVVYDADEDIPRRYLRKKACEALELPKEHSNWKEMPFRENMERTAERLKPRFDDISVA